MNKDAIVAGQAVYSKNILSIYDIWVLGISNHLLWKCPTRRISQQFIDLTSDNHLDVGVGTGYYLKKHLSPTTRRIALVDLNENSLASTSKAIEHFNPEVYSRNVFEPLDLNCEKFDTVSINYLLHCLPGEMSEKGIAFSRVKDVMNDGGTVFGSTILGKGTPQSGLAKKLMAFYNEKGIFTNVNDDVNALSVALEASFTDVKIDIVGCVALFSGKKRS
ncbi:class I SAM-dependent methyltransferase [Moritella sp. 24]|uniref:class I SAM-dependent methyltransferase n=1 Tax=Moritella sp. 24 TaxID=2746230 RepID=UPI001BA4BDA5|nr:class I SAM-dependent methyltransferase [Moritella sp. 24]QUM77056.1 class I SAM-dependent methyltransferase [Moritella sp. 24]